LFEMMEVLGKDRTVSRVRNAIERFSIPS